jgi:hypothetical protein
MQVAKLLTIGLALALALLLKPLLSVAGTEYRWAFDRSRDQLNWTIPPDMGGAVLGGAMWLTFNPKSSDPREILKNQVWGDVNERLHAPRENQVLSPEGLDALSPASGQLQVRLQVLNLSPVTDIFLRWRAKGESWAKVGSAQDKPLNSRRCALRSDLKQWQEITCYIDAHWKQPIDQIALFMPERTRGDMWIRSIELFAGPDEPEKFRPDLFSDAVVPKISVPGLSQAGFADAFKVLGECLIVDVPIFGFTHPVISPGGGYRDGGWWEMDSSLAVEGAKWANPTFAENVMRGFRDVQNENPDGRIDVWGHSATRGQVGDISQIPVYFPVAYKIAHRTADEALRRDIYLSMKKYLNWWLSPVKRDGSMGLITGIFEETQGDENLGPGHSDFAAQTIAPVDLNVAVAVGALLTSNLAASLGDAEDARKYKRAYEELSQAINAVLWDEQDGAYYNYDLRDKRLRRRLIVSTFDPLRAAIAPPARRERLLMRLLDPRQFNWGKYPLSTLAMTDPNFVEAKGMYDGRGWWGNVWTIKNMTVVAGLQESARADLAAELNWATIKGFHANYHEFINPSSGEGQGVNRFAWSASQYIEAVIDHLFGVEYDAIERRLVIAPHVPKELYGKEITLEDLQLPSAGARLSVRITQLSATEATIRTVIGGKLPKRTQLSISLPGTTEERQVSVRRSFVAQFGRRS